MDRAAIANTALILIYALSGLLIIINLYAFWLSRQILKKDNPAENADHKSNNKKSFCYHYDNALDLFYPPVTSLGGTFKYSRPNDFFAPLQGAVLHCEPIYFEYDGKNWLIELWKGQYGAACGCEIGVFSASTAPARFKRGFYTTRYYNSTQLFPISVILYKNNEEFFRLHDLHWWLAGFFMGGYCNARDFTARIKISFKTGEMALAFSKGLKEAGYEPREYNVKANDVYVVFSFPHTPQPLLSRGPIAWCLLKYAKTLSSAVNSIIEEFDGSLKALDYIKESRPMLYKCICIGMRPLCAKNTGQSNTKTKH